eukprot:10682_3
MACALWTGIEATCKRVMISLLGIFDGSFKKTSMALRALRVSGLKDTVSRIFLIGKRKENCSGVMANFPGSISSRDSFSKIWVVWFLISFFTVDAFERRMCSAEQMRPLRIRSNLLPILSQTVRRVSFASSYITLDFSMGPTAFNINTRFDVKRGSSSATEEMAIKGWRYSKYMALTFC